MTVRHVFYQATVKRRARHHRRRWRRAMNLCAEYFETCSKKRRGMAKRSLDLIDAMYAAAEKAQPITGRGIGYKLFTAGLIPSMAGWRAVDGDAR
jgi:hypothetical protein